MIKATFNGWLRHDLSNRGITAWLTSFVLFSFYIMLYFGDRLFYTKNDPFVIIANMLKLPDKWILYGLIYTLFIIVFGLRVIIKYKHNKYQIIRTISVIFFQIVFAFSIPWILKLLEQPSYYFSYIWPLKIEYFYPSTIAHQPLPFVIYSFVAALLIAPLMAFFFGKRWYCSWVCGCGGLANTFGEPWRHLSSKSELSLKIEKITLYTILFFSILTTILVFVSVGFPKDSNLAIIGKEFRIWYGLVVGSILSGVVGVGLYPIAGTRIWCRYACPMAAILGIFQKFGRFHVSVKKDMCISCGMCSKYCEMGIDVRSYAQNNEDFTRASCVGCGICVEVCPRGVLNLENSPKKNNRND